MIDFVLRLWGWLGRRVTAFMSRLHASRFAACGPRAMIRRPRMLLGQRHVTIGADFDCFPGLRLEVFDRHLEHRYTPRVEIGDSVSINYDCHIGCVNHIRIGHRVLLASRVYITDHGHGAPDFSDIAVPPSRRQVHSKGPVIIGDDVWVGEGACILPGVTIGRGAVIGANAVVTHDIPPYCVAAGVPARVLRQLA